MSNITSIEINQKKIEIGKDNFPSDSYINFTLPAHGGTYTAPADGWVMVQVLLRGQNVYFGMNAGLLRLNCPVYTINNSQVPLCWSLPVNKGGTVQFFYNATVMDVNACMFIYAKSALAELED